MKKKNFFKTMCCLLFATNMAAIVMSSCGNEDDDIISLDKSEATVKAKYTHKMFTFANVAGRYIRISAQYNLEWPGVQGATEYKVYNSTAASGAGTLITTTKDLSTFQIESLGTSAGTYLRYYWVTAVTDNIETPRPANGGIKVTYTVTFSSGNCNIEQNPIK